MQSSSFREDCYAAAWRWRRLELDNAVIKISEVSRIFDRPPNNLNRGIGAVAVTDVSLAAQLCDMGLVAPLQIDKYWNTYELEARECSMSVDFELVPPHLHPELVRPPNSCIFGHPQSRHSLGGF